MRMSLLIEDAKFKLFNHSRQTHKIFRIGKYEKKIKFDKIRGYQNRESFNWILQNSNFSTIQARHVTLLE